MKHARNSKASAVTVPAGLKQPRQRYIFSGPFGGKTTATAYLRELGYHVWETDEERQKLPGWGPNLWSAWMSTNPNHRQWVELNERHFRNMRDAYRSGAIVITHDAPPDSVSVADAVLLDPGSEELVRRAEEFEEVGESLAKAGDIRGVRNVTHRYVAALHYWTKPGIKDWSGYRVPTIQKLIESW